MILMRGKGTADPVMLLRLLICSADMRIDDQSEIPVHAHTSVLKIQVIYQESSHPRLALPFLPASPVQGAESFQVTVIDLGRAADFDQKNLLGELERFEGQHQRIHSFVHD